MTDDRAGAFDLHLLRSAALPVTAVSAWTIDGGAQDDKPAPWPAIALLPADSPAPENSVACYRVDLVVGKPGPVGGLSLMALVGPIAGLSRTETFRHWSEHIPLAVAVHHKALSYRQFRVVRALTPDAPDAFGLAVLGFESHSALESGLFRNAHDPALIEADVAEFVGSVITMLGREEAC